MRKLIRAIVLSSLKNNWLSETLMIDKGSLVVLHSWRRFSDNKSIQDVLPTSKLCYLLLTIMSIMWWRIKVLSKTLVSSWLLCVDDGAADRLLGGRGSIPAKIPLFHNSTLLYYLREVFLIFFLFHFQHLIQFAGM